MSASRQERQDIPRPILTKADLQRGTVAAGSSCDDAGLLSMLVSLPDEEKRNIQEFGLQFNVVEGNDPYDIFPDDPIALWGETSTRSSDVLFVWLDGAPREHLPLEMTIEVRFVHGTQKGPSRRFRIE